jgi:hypothetical protein
MNDAAELPCNTGKRFPFFFILANFIGTTGGTAVAGCKDFVSSS